MNPYTHSYPYCYGYWKKYADYEKRNGGAKEKAMMVFERGIAAIPLSVDLWIHYLVRMHFKIRSLVFLFILGMSVILTTYTG